MWIRLRHRSKVTLPPPDLWFVIFLQLTVNGNSGFFRSGQPERKTVATFKSFSVYCTSRKVLAGQNTKWTLESLKGYSRKSGCVFWIKHREAVSSETFITRVYPYLHSKFNNFVTSLHRIWYQPHNVGVIICFFLWWRKVVKSTSLIYISLKCEMAFDMNFFLSFASLRVFTLCTKKARSRSSRQDLTVTGKKCRWGETKQVSSTWEVIRQSRKRNAEGSAVGKQESRANN